MANIRKTLNEKVSCCNKLIPSGTLFSKQNTQLQCRQAYWDILHDRPFSNALPWVSKFLITNFWINYVNCAIKYYNVTVKVLESHLLLFPILVNPTHHTYMILYKGLTEVRVTQMEHHSVPEALNIASGNSTAFWSTLQHKLLAQAIQWQTITLQN